MQGAENAAALKKLEDRILYVLSTSSGNILDDETAVKVLTESKTLSNDIEKKQKIARETESQIDEAREAFAPIARCASSLFMCIMDLSEVDAMYVYSLEWFMLLFEKAVHASREAPADPGSSSSSSSSGLRSPSSLIDHISSSSEHRIAAVNRYCCYLVYSNVSRSLFERHKLVFSPAAFPANAQSALILSEATATQYFRFLTTGGGVGEASAQTNPCSAWMEGASWRELHSLGELCGGALRHVRLKVVQDQVELEGVLHEHSRARAEHARGDGGGASPPWSASACFDA